jgi:hypothetical protein
MNNINETDSLRDELHKINHTIQCNKKAREELMSENKYGIRQPPITAFIILWVIDASIVAFTVYSIIDGGMSFLNLSVGLSMAVGVTLVNLLVYLPRIREINRIDAENKALYAELEKIEAKLKALEN